VLAAVSLNWRCAAALMMLAMIALSVGLKLVQRPRPATTAQLRAMISVTATAVRDGAPIGMWPAGSGDVVQLAAGT
jgi:hypothetical protein